MKFFVGLILLLISYTSFAVSLPSIFGTYMVLQQNSEIKFWGWGDPNEKIKITTSWGEEIEVMANYLAEWEVNLHTPKTGEIHNITIQGYNKIVLNDILLGEVWLCSGQSNMQKSAASGITNGKEHIKNANYPEIRFFAIPKRSSDYIQLDVDARWQVCTPETMKHFTAVGYFFGEKLFKELNVPIGLINASWGGTPAEAWSPKEYIESDEILLESSKKLKETPWGPYQTSVVYNAMISPIIPFKIAGTIWYQGEENTQNPDNYSLLLTTMIGSWRDKWKNEFPFYFVQIAPYQYGEDDFAGVVVRDQQRRTLAVEKTGMVVISDVGNIKDIHPKNKYDVGLRLANVALTKTYGVDDIQYSGPLYKNFKIEGKSIRVFFDYGSGLMSPEKKLQHFEIAGADGIYFPASAKIDGESIVVKSKNVKVPKSMRYAWKNAIEPDLTNNSGLPTSSFISD